MIYGYLWSNIFIEVTISFGLEFRCLIFYINCLNLWESGKSSKKRKDGQNSHSCSAITGLLPAGVWLVRLHQAALLLVTFSLPWPVIRKWLIYFWLVWISDLSHHKLVCLQSLDTGLSLIENDHVTWILASHWSRHFCQPEESSLFQWVL